MFFKHIIRFISTNNIVHQSNNKFLLSCLRKKTGYTFSNCKKALEVNENNLEKAENWLKEQAQSLGWSKAEQLQNRTTSQGLISIIINKCHSTIIEINCETDFVSYNKQFRELNYIVASAILKYTQSNTNESIVKKTVLDSDELKSLPGIDGKSVADHTALMIGQIRENIIVKRASCMSVPSDVLLIGSTHPFSSNNNMLYGKYGVLLALKSISKEKQQEIGQNLCQHIIGMNPVKIGNPKHDHPNPNPEDETTLIHQEYLLNRSLTINNYLQETESQVLDFTRYQLGEITERQQSLDTVETGG